MGLPLAMAAAGAGWKVFGLDNSEIVINSLQKGISHIADVSDDELKKWLSSEDYLPTSEWSLVSEASVVVICLPTPLNANREPDLGALESGLKQIGTFLAQDALVINESTSYPGTLREFIVPLLRKLRSESLDEMFFASAPERIDPLNENWNLKNTPRIVAGITHEASLLAFDFYSSFCENVVQVSSPELCEAAKLLENTFRQVNIALVNQLVPLCNELGINARELVEAAGSKPYGYMKFYPGAGVGGHCIPIDPLYLLWKARQVGYELPFVAKADEVNGNMPKYVVERVVEMASPQLGAHVAILGVAYKSGISDVRESPAEHVAQALVSKGFKPVWVDPLVESFHGFEKHNGHKISGAIVVTAQEGLPVRELAESGVPILDCTGVYKGISGVEQL